MAQPLILAIDQGTTSSRAIVFNTKGESIAVAQEEFPQIYPQDGWVEHDPEAIWHSTLKTAQHAVQAARAVGGTFKAIGISNQRETTLIWDRKTGKPIYNAIVWQDRRTEDNCAQMRHAGLEQDVQAKTGLLLDPYFSAAKISWILDNVEGARARAMRGELAFGTVDSFLIWRLTVGQVHATDATNASRTSLYNISEDRWDDDLCAAFNVPMAILPEVKDCADDFGVTDKALFGEEIQIGGVAGDQQAAAIGQCCFSVGDVKSTYGTGCFVLTHTGKDLMISQNRLLSTIAYRLGGVVHYALEGSIFIAGAAIQWLRDEMKLISHARETEALAQSIDTTGGVYLVPAFTGLGAPHWDARARGSIFGLTRDSGRAHIVRAALESVVYQTADLVSAMHEDGISPRNLRVDGGMVANNWLCQYLSDILEISVVRPKVMETSALGVAILAGVHVELFAGIEAGAEMWRLEADFEPVMEAHSRIAHLAGWHEAVRRTLST